MSRRPYVSVLVPVRNEASFVGRLLAALLDQDYPADRLEIIVADGQSTDGTRDVLARFARRHARITAIENPGQIASAGLNAALDVAHGEVIVRIDGHAMPAHDFISASVALLEEHPEAWSVGGPIRHVGTTSFGKAAAVAMSHPIGVGNARHRNPDYEGYVEGAQFPAIRRWVFERIGPFDERLVRNQDDEFNFRLGRAGGKVFVSPRVRYKYFVRDRLARLFTQYFQYGFWRIPVIEKHGRPTTARQLVPAAFLVSSISLAVVGAVLGRPVLAAGLPALYAVVLCAAAAATLPRQPVRVALRIPIAIATLHVAYGLGTAYGLWARCFRPSAWDTNGAMAAISR